MVAGMAIRTVIAEDNLLVREGVTRLLDLQATSRSSRRAAISMRSWPRSSASGPTSSSRTSACRPGGADEGIQAADRLRDMHPEIGVIVLSQYAEPAYALALFEGGQRAGAPTC